MQITPIYLYITHILSFFSCFKETEIVYEIPLPLANIWAETPSPLTTQLKNWNEFYFSIKIVQVSMNSSKAVLFENDKNILNI